nr:YeeE/YedE thiosulfate transporter family protein [Nitrospiraceae bacterium]
AVLGFAIGILTTTSGVLRPVYLFLRSYKVGLTGADGQTNYGFAVFDLFGGSETAKWVTIGVIAVIAGIYLLKGNPFQKGPAKGYKWSTTGLFAGIITIAAWWASGVYGKDPRGLSFTGPMGEFFQALFSRTSHSERQMFNFGWVTVTWSAMYILTVPIGAYLSARALKEFKLKSPAAAELLTVFGGSLLMGFGASVAGG